VKVEWVVVDQEDAALIETVKMQEPAQNLQVVLVNPRLNGPERRKEHEERMMTLLVEHGIHYIFLAGFMRILSPIFVSRFRKRLINIHPSLLPKFPGLHAYEQAFMANDSQSGITVHFVDEGVDTGPIIEQISFPRLDTDSIADFIARGKSLEWTIYPEVLKRLDRDGKL
jgi:phosphoribosylglycinamide formyltransferase-1